MRGDARVTMGNDDSGGGSCPLTVAARTHCASPTVRASSRPWALRWSGGHSHCSGFERREPALSRSEVMRSPARRAFLILVGVLGGLVGGFLLSLIVTTWTTMDANREGRHTASGVWDLVAFGVWPALSAGGFGIGVARWTPPHRSCLHEDAPLPSQAGTVSPTMLAGRAAPRRQASRGVGRGQARRHPSPKRCNDGVRSGYCRANRIHCGASCGTEARNGLISSPPRRTNRRYTLSSAGCAWRQRSMKIRSASGS